MKSLNEKYFIILDSKDIYFDESLTQPIEIRSPVRSFFKNKLATLSLIILIIIILMVIFGPFLSDYQYNESNIRTKNLKPSLDHFFGTDEVGRDIFIRVCIGGIVDDIIMSLTGWCTISKIVRAQLLQLKEQDYILAAHALGASSARIISKHLIGNLINTAIVIISLEIPLVILTEATLSYMGFDVQTPYISLGIVAHQSQFAFIFYPYQTFIPAAFIAVIIICFNLIGEGLKLDDHIMAISYTDKIQIFNLITNKTTTVKTKFPASFMSDIKLAGKIVEWSRIHYVSSVLSTDGKNAYMFLEYRYLSEFIGHKLLTFSLNKEEYMVTDYVDKINKGPFSNPVSYKSNNTAKFLISAGRVYEKKEIYTDILEVTIDGKVASNLIPLSRSRRASMYPAVYNDTAIFCDFISGDKLNVTLYIVFPLKSMLRIYNIR